MRVVVLLLLLLKPGGGGGVSSMGVKRPKNERVVRITVRRGARNNRGFFSPTRITQAVENPNEILLLRFGCVVLFDDARARRLCPPRKSREDVFRRLSRRLLPR